MFFLVFFHVFFVGVQCVFKEFSISSKVFLCFPGEGGWVDASTFYSLPSLVT